MGNESSALRSAPESAPTTPPSLTTAPGSAPTTPPSALPERATGIAITATTTPHEGEGPPGEGQEPKWWKRGEVINIASGKDWEEKCHQFIKSPTNNTLVVVEFTSPNSGPSRFIDPFIKRKAETNKDVLFVRLNYEKLEEVAAQEKVEVVPTFLLFKGGQKIGDPIIGARRQDLSTQIKELKN